MFRIIRIFLFFFIKNNTLGAHVLLTFFLLIMSTFEIHSVFFKSMSKFCLLSAIEFTKYSDFLLFWPKILLFRIQTACYAKSKCSLMRNVPVNAFSIFYDDLSSMQFLAVCMAPVSALRPQLPCHILSLQCTFPSEKMGSLVSLNESQLSILDLRISVHFMLTYSLFFDPIFEKCFRTVAGQNLIGYFSKITSLNLKEQFFFF